MVGWFKTYRSLLSSAGLLGALLALGCSEQSSPQVGDLTPVVKDDAGIEDDTGAQSVAQVCGRLLLGEESAFSEIDVILCNEDQCNTATTAGDGAFCVEVREAADYMFHFPERVVGETRYADVIFPLVVSADQLDQAQRIDVGEVRAPTIAQVFTLDSANGGVMDLGGGLSINIPANATTLPPLMTSAEVGGAAVDTADLHPRLLASALNGRTPDLAFVFVPLAATFSEPVAFSLPAGGIAAGTALDIYRADHETGILKLHGEAIVDDSDKVTNATGQGLSGLGWILFYRRNGG